MAKITVRIGVLALPVVVVALCAPASAHGDLRGSNPEDGAAVGSVPGSISVTLTEAPGPGSVLKASDGCGRKVRGSVKTQGSDLVLSVASGQPGKWKASYRAISSVDGHLTKGELAFSVKGKKDCTPGGNDEDDTKVAGGKDTRVDDPNPDEDGGGFPVVPFAIGTAVVIVLALVVRRAAS